MDNPACNYHMVTTRYAPENTTLTAKKKGTKRKTTIIYKHYTKRIVYLGIEYFIEFSIQMGMCI
jgi:hypothetical protein